MAFLVAVLGVCLFRLVQMQLLSFCFYRASIAELQKNKSRPLATVRGRILDRNSRVLALDEPRFELRVSRELAMVADRHYQQTRLLKAAGRPDAAEALAEVTSEIKTQLAELQSILEKCAEFSGLGCEELRSKIDTQNELLWARRTFLAWVRSCADSALLKQQPNAEAIALKDAMADFERDFPSEQKRLLLTARVPVEDLQLPTHWPLVDLRTDDDVLAAQLEFMDKDGVEIAAYNTRVYPYSSVAAQTIGWVGPVQVQDPELFSRDPLRRYLPGELFGRGTGAEFVCEAVLRGRRGQIVYNFDNEPISRTEMQFGQNVQLTLDIELQKRIENYLVDAKLNPNYQQPMAVVLIEVASGQILALVSLPSFDLNRARIDYEQIIKDPHEPARNRALQQRYPPGSVIKPLILIAGLEAGKISAEGIISCPSQPAPAGWPNCWLFARYKTGHDSNWPNHARNAIKGSCNIYFSRLAERVEPAVLQGWLFKFGYGRQVLAQPNFRDNTASLTGRNFAQYAGVISSNPEEVGAAEANEIPVLVPGERRYFAIGQGNLRATPLQVANAMAAIARSGVYKPPTLVIEQSQHYEYDLVDLNISPGTLDVVRDGMRAVVNEPGGTAYKEFQHSGLAKQDVVVYGKTGSTEKPDHAWFAGFAEDSEGHNVAIAVVVEGGQHGSADAGPLARDILQFCIEAGYLGRTLPTTH